MKKIFFLLFILSFVLFTNCRENDPNNENGIDDILSAENDREFDGGSFIVFPELNKQLIADLELLCKVWGFLKYHHPESEKGNIIGIMNYSAFFRLIYK